MTRSINNIDVAILLKKQNKYEKMSLEENFWNDSDNAKKILKKISTIKKEINQSKVLMELFSEITDYIELVELGEDLTSESIDALQKFSTGTIVWFRFTFAFIILFLIFAKNHLLLDEIKVLYRYC